MSNKVTKGGDNVKKIITFIFLLFLIFSLAACGDQNNEPSKETAGGAVDNEDESIGDNNEKADESSNVYFDGEVAEIEDVRIEIKETKVIPAGEEGNEYGEKPVFAIWYDATNKSDKDIDPNMAWFAIFTAVQDNDPDMVNELEVAGLPDESHLDSQSNYIKKGGTVENSVAYELDDKKTPVILIATQGVGGEEISRAKYEIDR